MSPTGSSVEIDMALLPVFFSPIAQPLSTK